MLSGLRYLEDDVLGAIEVPDSVVDCSGPEIRGALEKCIAFQLSSKSRARKRFQSVVYPTVHVIEHWFLQAPDDVLWHLWSLIEDGFRSRTARRYARVASLYVLNLLDHRGREISEWAKEHAPYILKSTRTTSTDSYLVLNTTACLLLSIGGYLKPLLECGIKETHQRMNGSALTNECRDFYVEHTSRAIYVSELDNKLKKSLLGDLLDVCHSKAKAWPAFFLALVGGVEYSGVIENILERAVRVDHMIRFAYGLAYLGTDSDLVLLKELARTTHIPTLIYAIGMGLRGDSTATVHLSTFLVRDRDNTYNIGEDQFADVPLLRATIDALGTINTPETRAILQGALKHYEGVEFITTHILRIMNNTANTNTLDTRVSVFLCYAGEDRPIVEKISAALPRDEFRVFYDQESLLPGDDLHELIEHNLRLCDIFVFVLSPFSLVKPWPIHELRMATSELQMRSAGKRARVVPVRLDECEPPLSLKHVVWLDVSRSEPSPSIEKLVQVLKVQGARVRTLRT